MQPAVTLSREDLWKSLAIALMTLDHVGWLFFPEALWFRAIGRLCVPIWLFYAGYHAHSLGTRVLLPAIVAVTLFDLAMGEHGQLVPPVTILLTIYLCKWLLARGWLSDPMERAPLSLAMACMVLAPMTALVTEYGSSVFLFAVFGYAVRHGHAALTRWPMVLAAMVGFLAVHQVFFPFSGLQYLCIGGGVLAVCYGLMQYGTGELQLKLPIIARVPLRLLGRNSLRYYVLHKLVLQSAAKFA